MLIKIVNYVMMIIHVNNVKMDILNIIQNVINVQKNVKNVK